MAIPGGAARSVISLGSGHSRECASVFRVASVLVSEFGAHAFDTESGRYPTPGEIDATAAACYQALKSE